MAATLSAATPVLVDSDEYLEYVPPATSTLAGGTVEVNLSADGYGVDSTGRINAVAVSALYEPALEVGPTDLFCPVEMENLLGEDAADWARLAAEKDARVWLYGKQGMAPGRKMGHVNRLKRP